jgi:hypothetical protein
VEPEVSVERRRGLHLRKRVEPNRAKAGHTRAFDCLDAQRPPEPASARDRPYVQPLELGNAWLELADGDASDDLAVGLCEQDRTVEVG